MKGLSTLLTQACNRGIQRHGYRNFRRTALGVLLCANLALWGVIGHCLYNLGKGCAHLIVAQLGHGALVPAPTGADLRDAFLPILGLMGVAALSSVLIFAVYECFASWCQNRLDLPKTLSMHEQLRRFGHPLPPS